MKNGTISIVKLKILVVIKLVLNMKTYKINWLNIPGHMKEIGINYYSKPNEMKLKYYHIVGIMSMIIVLILMIIVLISCPECQI